MSDLPSQFLLTTRRDTVMSLLGFSGHIFLSLLYSLGLFDRLSPILVYSLLSVILFFCTSR